MHLTRKQSTRIVFGAFNHLHAGTPHAIWQFYANLAATISFRFQRLWYQPKKKTIDFFNIFILPSKRTNLKKWPGNNEAGTQNIENTRYKIVFQPLTFDSKHGHNYFSFERFYRTLRHDKKSDKISLTRSESNWFLSRLIRIWTIAILSFPLLLGAAK